MSSDDATDEQNNAAPQRAPGNTPPPRRRPWVRISKMPGTASARAAALDAGREPDASSNGTPAPDEGAHHADPAPEEAAARAPEATADETAATEAAAAAAEPGDAPGKTNGAQPASTPVPDEVNPTSAQQTDAGAEQQTELNEQTQPPQPGEDAEQQLIPDREALAQFADLMFRRAHAGGYFSLRAFREKSKKEKPIFVEAIQIGDADFLDIAFERARQAATYPTPAVFSPPVATFKNPRDAKGNNLNEGVVLSIECDQAPAAARARLEALLGTATAVIASGGEWTDPATGEVEPKLHLHWRLRKPTSTKAEHALLYEARELATGLVGSDATAVAIVHPMRWPGSWHRKGAPRLAKIVAVSECEIDLLEAVERLRDAIGARDCGDESVRQTGRLGAADHAAVAEALAVIPNDDLAWVDWNRIGMAVWAATDGSDIGRAAFAAWSAKSAKNDKEATEARWQHYASSPPTRIGFGTLVYLARKHAPGWRYGRAADPASGPRLDMEDVDIVGGGKSGGDREIPEPPRNVGGRPTAFYGRLSKMADRAAAILRAAKVPFYQHGRSLVRPVVLPIETFHGKTTRAAQLVEVEVHYLRDVLCRKSQWLKFDKRSWSWVNIHPPVEAALVLLKRFGDWNFPAIAGLIGTPTLRPDGTILAAPGFDWATRLLLVDPPTMPAIAESPSRDDALAALALLKGLLDEFPFVDDTARSVALSAQISTVCRGAYELVPMHVVHAPVPGSGKSYLLSTISAIVSGQAMPVIGAGKNEEEMEKRLGAAVIQGRPLICLDNVVGKLGGDELCRLVEQPRPSVRVLGYSQLVEVEARGVTFFANGNNIVIVGDLCRRVIHCRLDPQMERPELRAFKGDPMQDILDNRGVYIAAALTVCRAYIAAGRPALLPPLASYGAWSDTVRSALVWLDEPDPVDSMDTSQADDPERGMLLTMLTEWTDAFGTGIKNAQTLRDVIDLCNRSGSRYAGLRTAVAAVMPPRFRQQLDVTALGLWLRGQKDRRVNGMRFNNKPNTHGPVPWWVET